MSHDADQSQPLWRIPNWFQTLNITESKFLKAYHSDLVKWTKSINLISKGTVHEADRIHLSDSILGCQTLEGAISPSEAVWDLGSGNGLPGVVLSILRPGVNVTCIDSDSRKMAFVRQFGLTFNIKNLGTRTDRIEDIPTDSISQAVTRGLGTISFVNDLCLEKVVSGGAIFHFKGAEWENELLDSESKHPATWKSSVLGSYTLPIGENSSEIEVKRWIVKSKRL